MVSRNIPFKFPVSVLIGSKPSNILQVIKGYKIDLQYYPKFILSFIVSGIFRLMNLWERLIYRKEFKKIGSEEPPVLIIGFWRSGTTLLHSLMCQDPCAGYVTTFQAVFPNLVLTRYKWMKRIANWALPKKRPFDSYPMDMDFPQEEEFGLMSLQPKSIYKIFYFPKDYNDIYKTDLYFERLSDASRKCWEKEYLNLIDRAMINTGGERYISKNPCNIFRIKTLIGLFPDARFIFIYRNPYTVVESVYRFVNAILPGSELQHLEGGIPREYFARLYKDSINEYMDAKEIIRPDNLMEIRYEEFKERPVEFLCDIYSRFNIPGIEQVLPRMESYLANNNPDTRAAYQIAQETYQLVNEYSSDIVRKLGYPIVESPDEYITKNSIIKSKSLPE
jgi:hypothetical protein